MVVVVVVVKTINTTILLLLLLTTNTIATMIFLISSPIFKGGQAKCVALWSSGRHLA